MAELTPEEQDDLGTFLRKGSEPEADQRIIVAMVDVWLSVDPHKREGLIEGYIDDCKQGDVFAYEALCRLNRCLHEHREPIPALLGEWASYTLAYGPPKQRRGPKSHEVRNYRIEHAFRILRHHGNSEGKAIKFIEQHTNLTREGVRTIVRAAKLAKNT